MGEKVCNRCGRKFDMWDEHENFSMNMRLGYGTVYDGQVLDLKLCCSCMERLIKKCKVSPVHKEVL